MRSLDWLGVGFFVSGLVSAVCGLAYSFGGGIRFMGLTLACWAVFGALCLAEYRMKKRLGIPSLDEPFKAVRDAEGRSGEEPRKVA